MVDFDPKYFGPGTTIDDTKWFAARADRIWLRLHTEQDLKEWRRWSRMFAKFSLRVIDCSLTGRNVGFLPVLRDDRVECLWLEVGLQLPYYDRSVIVCPEADPTVYDSTDLHQAYGICSDHIVDIREELERNR